MLMDLRAPRGSGEEPWYTEPDRVAWRDAETALQCLILRGPMGSLCGYVRVPRDHPLHRKHYRHRSIERRIGVHGGITFSGCLGGRKMKRGHWFGFDCAHWCDLVPGLIRHSFYKPDSSCVYRDIAYVREQCTSLAAQLAACWSSAAKGKA
jgi:hypothetical protein